MRYALEMTNQQIADTLGISLKGAEQLTARLKRLLRERFRRPM
jgi:DNA-directed RNA polymerase specialized sigma24 family protein